VLHRSCFLNPLLRHLLNHANKARSLLYSHIDLPKRSLA
jgi:hypothetical protein